MAARLDLRQAAMRNVRNRGKHLGFAFHLFWKSKVVWKNSEKEWIWNCIYWNNASEQWFLIFNNFFALSLPSNKESLWHWSRWEADSWGIYPGYAPHWCSDVWSATATCTASRVHPTFLQVTAHPLGIPLLSFVFHLGRLCECWVQDTEQRPCTFCPVRTGFGWMFMLHSFQNLLSLPVEI